MINHDKSSAIQGINRRHFLRGLGACLALPALPSLTFGASAAGKTAANLATTTTGAPLRSAFVFFPNGAIPAAWWPDATGSDFAVSRTLAPLEPMKNMIQVMGGLDHRNAIGGADGAGDHARGTGVFLTGVRLKKSPTDVHAGISIDQMIAQRTGHLTRLPSLELTCDSAHKSAVCDSNYACAYQYNLSWSSPTTPMTPESNPRLAFERLFGQGEHGQRRANARLRQVEERSILDFVMEDARRMQRNLDSRDREKLDQYLTGVREVETQIQQAEKFGPNADPEIPTPAGVPASYAEYIQLMFDMVALAFQTDSTRIATICLAHDGDNRSFSDIGIPEGHHDLSHHQGREERIKKVQEIDLWYVRQFARFTKKLGELKDTDGNSILHNSMIVYGGGNADGNMHSHTNLPIILAGAGGGAFNPGRYVAHGSKPMCNLYLTMAQQMGLRDLQRFGDSTTHLSNV